MKKLMSKKDIPNYSDAEHYYGNYLIPSLSIDKEITSTRRLITNSQNKGTEVLKLKQID